MNLLHSIEIRQEHDVVLARQRARQIATILGFDVQDQTRFSTSVSEIARNAFQYAGGGRAEFHLDPGPPRTLLVVVRDTGPGITDLKAILDGRYRSATGMGLGLVGARRVMERFAIESTPGVGTAVSLGKPMPRKAAALDAADLVRQIDELVQRDPASPFEEIKRQNQELLRTLDELRRLQSETAHLNRELEETNRGVMALYAELDERAIALQRASELKTRFLSNMSHEFRTPLNSIRSLARFLLDPTDGELSAEKEKQTRYILKAAENLSEMVNDLLDLAKVEAGKVDVRVEPFECGNLFAALRGMFRPLVDPASPVALVFDEPEGMPTLLTDESKLAQILRNFISNALKFTERGEVRVSATSWADDTVSFSVSDSGIGIDPGDLGRIFDEFAQVDGPTQRRVKGTGLGLPLSRKLAELLGGSVTVTSRPGVGSTFTTTIPRCYPEAPAEVVPPGPAQAAPDDSGPILIVDDDEVARYVLRALLAGLVPMTIIEARDGSEGLRLARDARPRVIFLDLAMPDLSGFEVLDRLKSDPVTEPIPVVIHSSQTLDESDRIRLSAGSAAILGKDGASRDEASARLHAVLARVGLIPAARGKGTAG